MKLISQSAMKMIRSGQPYSLEREIEDNTVVHINLKPMKNGNVHISGHLMSQNPRKRMREIHAVTSNCKNINLLEYVVRDVCTTLGSRLRKSKEEEKHREPRKGSFAERVYSLPDILNPENYNGLAPKGWGKESTKQYVSYYANTIGEVYKRYGEEATREDFLSFQNEEVERIYATRYKHPCKDGQIALQRRDKIYNGVNDRFAKAAIIQRYILSKYPDMNWPSEPIPVMARVKTAEIENIKTITYSQYIMLLTILRRLCEAEVPHAYALLLEAVCGARIGESCAPLIGEFELREDYGRYYIDHQVDSDGNRTQTLKK